MLHGAGFFAKLTLLIAFTPLVVAVMYVTRPTERRLALMRPGLAGGNLGGASMAASSACSTCCALSA